MYHQQYQRRQADQSPTKGEVRERREEVNRTAKEGEEDDEHSRARIRQPNRRIKSLEGDEAKIEGAVELSEEEVELSEDEVDKGEEQR